MKNTNGTVKLIIQLALILIAAVAAWSAVRHQVVDNTDDIKVIKEVEIPKIDAAKLDKEVFSMYLDQQKEADAKQERMLDKMDGKLDKVLQN